MEPDPLFSAQALVHARRQAGLTQAEVARRLGLAGGERVSTWERGLAAPQNPKQLHALAAALNVQPIDLLNPNHQGGGLRWYRTLAGMSVAELALAAHVSAATVKRWESQGIRRDLPEATVRDLAEALKVTPSAVTDALRR
ncbi:MAG: helix-turn-helix transcriptional regulator [Acidimicrobiales bacterium]|nr:helix-turn-helix transcriptional regulator [Acidimicrobiales bacterium]